jgi:hypothetical protein
MLSVLTEAQQREGDRYYVPLDIVPDDAILPTVPKAS